MPAGKARIAPLASVFAVNGAVYGSLLPRYPEIADRVGASAGEFGLALAGIGVGGVTGAFVATLVVRALGGPVRALVFAGSAFLVAAVSVAAAPSLTLLVSAFVALGLFDGFVDTAMNQAGAALRAHSGVSVMGRLHATLAAATLTGTAGGVLVTGRLSVLSHLLVMAVVLLIVLLVALHHLSKGPVPHRDMDARSIPQVAELPASPPSPVPPLVRWWVLISGAGLAAVLVELPAQEWSGLLLARELSAGPTIAASGPLVAVAGVLVGRLMLDRFVDAIGWRIVLRIAGGLTAVGTVAAVVCGAVTREPAPVLIGFGVAAVGAGVAAPLLFDRAGHLAGRVGLASDSGAGLISGVFRLGVLISPLLVGGIAESTNLFLALAVSAIAGAVLAIFATPLAGGAEGSAAHR